MPAPLGWTGFIWTQLDITKPSLAYGVVDTKEAKRIITEIILLLLDCNIQFKFPVYSGLLLWFSHVDTIYCDTQSPTRLALPSKVCYVLLGLTQFSNFTAPFPAFPYWFKPWYQLHILHMTPCKHWTAPFKAHSVCHLLPLFRPSETQRHFSLSDNHGPSVRSSWL